jgi:NADH-quinone oxidoreductase subunit M
VDSMPGLLTTAVLLPLAGAVLVVTVARAQALARWCALGCCVAVIVLCGVLTQGFLNAQQATGGSVAEPFAVVDHAWLPPESGIDVHFALGLDGISIWLFDLSAILMLTAVLVSWEAIRDSAALFYAMLLLLLSGCLGVFASRDLMLFYVFFEFTLIPLFFLIGIWGSEDRRYAATKFFLYTLAGSLITFLGLLSIVWWHYHQGQGGQWVFSIPVLTSFVSEGGTHAMPVSMQTWIFLALFAGFAIKVPLFPLHTWLPLAHVQAPTAGSVILAGVLLKIGTYGFLRFSLPLLPDATAIFVPWMLGLAVAGILYGALVALAQSDMKRLIAYSSVSHLGFCMLGLFALNRIGTQGALLQMVNHGISTGGLFAIVGMLYERYHTREIAQLGGLARKLPVLAFFMLVFTFSSIGLPGLNGFAGEIMILVGMFQRGWAEGPIAYQPLLQVVAVLAVLGVVLGAWYMLWLVQRVFFGPIREPAGDHGHHEVKDLSVREIVALLPLAILAFWIGLTPQFFLAPTARPLDELTSQATARLGDIVAPEVAHMIPVELPDETSDRGTVPVRYESTAK